MLAIILKAAGIIFLAFAAFMTYALLRAASEADDYDGFDEYYWRNE